MLVLQQVPEHGIATLLSYAAVVQEASFPCPRTFCTASPVLAAPTMTTGPGALRHPAQVCDRGHEHGNARACTLVFAPLLALRFAKERDWTGRAL